METKLNTNDYSNYAHVVMNEIKSENSSYVLDFNEMNFFEQNNDALIYLHLQQKPMKKAFNILSYENTKNMTASDVENYFPNKTATEKSHIRFMITISNNFSKNDIVNKAIFEEVRLISNLNDRIEYSFGLALEKENFILGVPALHDVLVVSKEWLAYRKAGGTNGAKQGVFMNKQHRARYEQNKTIKYNAVPLSQEEATDFLITMLNLAKDNYKASMRSEYENDYKVALDRYSCLYASYIKLLVA